MTKSKIDISFNHKGELVGLSFIDNKNYTLSRVERTDNSPVFGFTRRKLEAPARPELMDEQNPSEWGEQQVLDFAKSMIKSKNIIPMINGIVVDKHEFTRKIFNTELADKLPVSELVEIRKAGGVIATTVDKINAAHFISIEDYKQLQNFDKKTGGKLHL